MLTKFSGTSGGSAPSGGKKKKRKVEEGALGDKSVVSLNAGREDSKHGPPVTKRGIQAGLPDHQHQCPTSFSTLHLLAYCLFHIQLNFYYFSLCKAINTLFQYYVSKVFNFSTAC